MKVCTKCGKSVAPDSVVVFDLPPEIWGRSDQEWFEKRYAAKSDRPRVATEYHRRWFPERHGLSSTGLCGPLRPWDEGDDAEAWHRARARR